MNDFVVEAKPVLAAREHIFRFVLAFVLLAVLPNMIFWVMERWFDLGRSVFNLDYFFAGIFFAIGCPYIGGTLFAVFFVIDVLVLVGQVYPFLRLPDLAYLVGLLPQASGFLQLFFAAVVIYFFIIGFVMVRRGVRIGLMPAIVSLNIALLLYGAHVYGGSGGGGRLWLPKQGVVVDSQSINFIENRMGGFVESFSLSGEPFEKTGYRGRTAGWMSSPVSDLNPKLLLIVAESWGRLVNDQAQQAIVKPVMDMQARFDWVKQGEMPFRGATVAAEFRELCGLKPNHFNLKGVEAGFEACLPRKLRDDGYKTAAIHGAVGLMYDRLYWYPRAGFQQVHFKETDDWDSRCYSFPGICDWEIAQDYISDAFAGGGKRFVYWLTLNSHSIYDERDLHGRFFECAAYGLPADSDICRMALLQAQFFHDLAQILDDDSMKGVEVLIVGDHMPPLISTENKTALIKDDTVSWLHFKIGGGGVDLRKLER